MKKPIELIAQPDLLIGLVIQCGVTNSPLNCLDRIQQLASMGHELRRPLADFLRDGIYELRANHRRVQYRILYFFHGQNIAIVAHAIIKEDSAVPDIEINRAIDRQQLFIANPTTHTYQEETSDDKN